MKVQKTHIPGSENKAIHIDYILNDQVENAPMIIFVHGFKGFKDWGTHHLVADFFANNGFSFLKFNFSHNGMSKEGIDTFDDLESFGHNTFSKELKDLDEVITYAKSGASFPSPTKIFLIGHSMGGGISILQTFEDRRVDKLVTWASISNFRGLWNSDQEKSWKKNGVIYMDNSRTNQQMPLYSVILEDLEKNTEKLDILNAARSLTQPWLIVQGEIDTTIKLEQAQLLQRQHPDSWLIIVENADHVFNARHPWSSDELPLELKKACDTTLSFLKDY